jgi:hypothetical protein
MFKKITLIVFLSIGLAVFLYLRPYIFQKESPPRMEDRLPDADFLGKAYLLEVARETSGMMYYHKVPFRDFISYEFLLGQSKMYGLNLQLPTYFFANETGDWGALAHVSDSSKILQGIERLKTIADVSDTVINNRKIYRIKKENAYLTYDRNYLFVYKGPNFKIIFNRITNCKHGDITNTWKSFLREKQFKDEKLVIYSNLKSLKENGLETAIFAHNSDSVSFTLLAYARNKSPLNVSMKEPGKNLLSGDYTNKMLNIHLDITKLRENPEDPLYKWMMKLGKRISFPTKDFIDAWEGDLSFRQGGYQIVKETYIESELDENFNVSEVEKVKDVKVPGFSMLLSFNKNGNRFMNKLFAKGILRQEENFYRFLFSPPLQMKKLKNYYIFHSGQYTPKTETSAKNNGIWTTKGTKIDFSLDSLSKYEAFGTIYIPVDRLISRNRFF